MTISGKAWLPLQDEPLRHGVAIVVVVEVDEAETDKYYMWTCAHDCSYELLGDLGRRGLGPRWSSAPAPTPASSVLGGP